MFSCLPVRPGTRAFTSPGGPWPAIMKSSYFVCVLQQRQGLSTGLASSVSSIRTATLPRSWEAKHFVCVCYKQDTSPPARVSGSQNMSNSVQTTPYSSRSPKSMASPCKSCVVRSLKARLRRARQQ